MENAKKFFEEVIKTEEAKAIISSLAKPETEKERIETYLDIAKKLGVQLTTEDIFAYLDAAAAVAAGTGEVDDEELAQLTGGGDVCADTFQQAENCWWNDGCDIILNDYDGYQCRTNGTKPKSGYNALHEKYFRQCGTLMVVRKEMENL